MMANEVRLIDANALLEEMDKFANPMPNQSGYEFLRGIATAITEIEEAPTVDAVPVVHGRWVKYIFLGHDQFACSECQTLGSPQWKRCPVCEAKMDGDGDG